MSLAEPSDRDLQYLSSTQNGSMVLEGLRSVLEKMLASIETRWTDEESPRLVYQYQGAKRAILEINDILEAAKAHQARHSTPPKTTNPVL